MKIALLLAAVLVSAGFAISTADASDDRRHGSVAGIVTTGDGRPVPGATVVLHRRGSDRVLRTHTNREGKFGFRHVPAGHYVIGAKKRGVGADRERIRVRPGHTTRVRLHLH